MATEVRIKIRRDTGANWTSKNPVLALGELGLDTTRNRLKAGNGTDAWNNRPWLPDDVYTSLATVLKMLSGVTGGNLLDPVETVSDLATTYPSPTAGDMAYVNDQNAFYTWNGTSWTKLNAQGMDAGAVNSAIDAKINAFSRFGIGYTVDTFNSFSKPTKITFADGVVFTLTWNGGTQLSKVTSSTGEVMTMTYDSDGRITGRTVTMP